MLNQICQAIDALLEQRDRVTVAIDGSCAAGKTTLAAFLAERYPCTVIHLDEFFLRPHQRTPARYAQPGGNVDYERFAEEVLAPLKAGLPFSYRPFDCRTFTLSDPVSITPGRLTIIEGSYSHHPYFGSPYDLKIFLTVDPDIRRQRILMRPPFLHRRFFEAWIPMEQCYFDTFRIPENSDLIF